jgi:hypothetical protein
MAARCRDTESRVTPVQHDKALFIGNQNGCVATDVANPERQEVSSLASPLRKLANSKCNVDDFLQAAIVLNIARATQTNNKLSVVVEPSVGQLIVGDTRQFILLNRMVSYLVDSRAMSSICIAAELSEVTAVGFSVKFSVTAKPIPGLPSVTHTSSQLGCRSSTEGVDGSVLCKLRDVTTVAIVLKTQIKTDFVSHTRPKLSFCVDATIADGCAFDNLKLANADDAVAQDKLNVLLVTCLSDSTSKLIQSLDGAHCTVSTFKDSLHALRTASANQFDLIFLDVRPGPIKCEALFKQLRSSKRHKSQESGIYAYGPSSDDGRKKLLHLGGILKTLSIGSNHNDPRFSQCIFQVVTKSSRGQMQTLPDRPQAPFEFCHTRLDELVRSMGYGRFLRSALTFVDELSAALTRLAEMQDQKKFSGSSTFLRDLTQTASHFGANAVTCLCIELELAIAASHTTLALKIGTRLAAAGLRAQLQLRSFSELVGGAPDVEYAASEALFESPISIRGI